jgi:hypothetical protein
MICTGGEEAAGAKRSRNALLEYARWLEHELLRQSYIQLLLFFRLHSRILLVVVLTIDGDGSARPQPSC